MKDLQKTLPFLAALLLMLATPALAQDGEGNTWGDWFQGNLQLNQNTADDEDENRTSRFMQTSRRTTSTADDRFVQTSARTDRTMSTISASEPGIISAETDELVRMGDWLVLPADRIAIADQRFRNLSQDQRTAMRTETVDSNQRWLDLRNWNEIDEDPEPGAPTTGGRLNTTDDGFTTVSAQRQTTTSRAQADDIVLAIRDPDGRFADEFDAVVILAEDRRVTDIAPVEVDAEDVLTDDRFEQTSATRAGNETRQDFSSRILLVSLSDRFDDAQTRNAFQQTSAERTQRTQVQNATATRDQTDVNAREDENRGPRFTGGQNGGASGGLY